MPLLETVQYSAVFSLQRIACIQRTVPLESIRTAVYSASSLVRPLFTPRAHARARGYVIGRGVYILLYIISLDFFLEPIFYLPKYSLSEVYFNTDRLLIEFNGLWYSLAARQVFVAIANPDSLSFG